MTISLERTDRIEMAEPNEPTLDELFERLEQSVPEGYKFEIVGGAVHMSPQRATHWETILDIVEHLRTRYPKKRVLSDVRIDFPGRLNGFASDVVAMAEDYAKTEKGRWRYQDIDFVAEVISEGTAANDYGPKKAVYAAAEVPVYVIADPYIGRCRVFTRPQDGNYKDDVTLVYGQPIDLTDTVVGITISTDDFPRD
ncbi:Uma2 family endonuclease [Streptomyces inhibens]|uniref:Uma2 family endonuclease n=1 Tax=Streptomyces inhibens TaxID=2293571 RepID=A0A371PQE7_STRIH|nr:Uma2 family endonuclease [Streptomyces inhibens]REK84569.1 Uma2 family endonuclease [Streptomyces inhibens]